MKRTRPFKRFGIVIAALFALTSASAFAEGDGQHGGQGQGGTDRSNSQAPLICRTGESAVPVQGADGKIAWKCSSPSELARAYFPSSCRASNNIDWTCRSGNA